MNKPLVSILIPTYNQRVEFLKESIQSAIHQSYSNIEVIISDNHSDKGIEEMVKAFDNGKVRLIKPQKHLQINQHFNFIASEANGDYISFLSSDDVLEPNCIERVMEYVLKENNIVMGYCENSIIDEKSQKLYLIRNFKLASGIYNASDTAWRMLNNTEYWIIGSVIKKSEFLKELFNDEVIAADWILGFKLLKYGKIAYVNQDLASIRFHERIGDGKEIYGKRKLDHLKQVTLKYALLLNDKELMKKMNINEGVLLNKKNSEILITAVIVTRNYHKNVINKINAKEILNELLLQRNSWFIKVLSINFSNKLGLMFTYLIGALRRLKIIL
jgi:cellulose synthase/poly-beta-1,6-N-acetylglucosamine synthase-like glycosyltransferase